MSKTIFMLTDNQHRALQPLYDTVRGANAIGEKGAIILQPQYDGRVSGAYIGEDLVNTINRALKD